MTKFGQAGQNVRDGGGLPQRSKEGPSGFGITPKRGQDSQESKMEVLTQRDTVRLLSSFIVVGIGRVSVRSVRFNVGPGHLITIRSSTSFPFLIYLGMVASSIPPFPTFCNRCYFFLIFKRPHERGKPSEAV